ncbi:MAG: hypothetical protein EAZ97_09060 [Bacteroidetes bacterium]|nr:MAG: hypothetical protein EAZ97_09060 [Bacteroidota bacterium]
MENHPNIHEFFKKIAEKLQGMAMEYTSDMGIISLRLPNGRSQNVRGFFKQKTDHWVLKLNSKVCSLDEYKNIDFKMITERNNKLNEAKAVIHQDYLEIAATILFSDSYFDHICSLVLEIAKAADLLEEEITGKDEN